MKLTAHITKIDNVRHEQSLKEHCFQTARYAAESVSSASLGCTAFLIGLLHDMGKAKEEFISYLEAAYQGEEVKKGSVNHTFAAVIWILENHHTSNSTRWERLTSEIIAYAVGAHHGMFDCLDLDGKNGFLHRLQKNKKEICYEEAIENFFAEVASAEMLEDCFCKSMTEIRNFFETAACTYENKSKDVFSQISMLVRLLLSAVIYGDRRDTGEFMMQKQMPLLEKPDWKAWQVFFEERLSALPSDSELNNIRREISQQCFRAAKRPCGIYRLNVPTGAGKTLCSLRYALEHARAYDKKRVIFIIPLLSVLDQNVKVIRDYLPEPQLILEHHSNVIHSRQEKEELDEYEILAESWGAPVVVSTMVQLLEILFSGKNCAIGRMQALCDSVIVIDEVQSLPKKVTVIFNIAVNFLQQFCNTTIVLSSATQPCFEELRWPLHLSANPDLVQLAAHQTQIFERAEILDRTDSSGMSIEECVSFCAERMWQHASLLVVCNTKAEARMIFEGLRSCEGHEDWDMFHLSTAMCQRHRMERLEELQEKLSLLQKAVREGRKGRKLLCVSTQLIEAGVDLSFEGVIRVLAGIDNLAQSAGRCNRSREYGGQGRVYLVNLKNESLQMLHEIQNAQNSTRQVLEYIRHRENISIIGEEATRKYYQYLYEEMKDCLEYPVKDSFKKYQDFYYLARLLANLKIDMQTAENRTYILQQPFQTIGREFQVFDQETTDIIVPYGEGEELIKELLKQNGKPVQWDLYRTYLQKIKPYAVGIYEWQKQKLEQEKVLFPVFEGRMFVLGPNIYDLDYGMTDVRQQPVENYIF